MSMWDRSYDLWAWNADEAQWIIVCTGLFKSQVRSITRAYPDSFWKLRCEDEGWVMEGSTQDVVRRLANGPFK